MIRVIILAGLLCIAAAQRSNTFCTKATGEVEVIMRPPEVIEVELGGQVSVVCAAHNHAGSDPNVIWYKGTGVGKDEVGEMMGVIGSGKATLFIPEVTEDHLDNYRCVIRDCCKGTNIDINIDIRVPDETCEDVYGIGYVVYAPVYEYVNWTMAVQKCEEKGMVLAFPKSAEENAQLLADIQKSFEAHPNAKKFAHENWLWIGANDLEQEDVWYDLDGNVVEWTNWDKSQPDDWQKYPGGQDCAGIFRKDGEWDDSFIHFNRPFVCKCPDKQ